MKRSIVHLRQIVFAALGGVLLISCRNDDSSTVEPPGSTVKAYISTAYGTYPTGSTRNIKGILAATTTRSGQLDYISVRGLFFGATSQQYRYTGTVFLNANLIDTLSSFGDVVYLRPGSHIAAPVSGVAFDGSYHYWSFGKTDTTAATIDSVRSPDGILQITFPQEGFVVSRDSTFIVTWSPATADTVLIVLLDETGKISGKVVTGTECSFGPSVLSKLGAGLARVEVSRYHHATHAAYGGNIVMLAIAFDQRDFRLE